MYFVHVGNSSFVRDNAKPSIKDAMTCN